MFNRSAAHEISDTPRDQRRLLALAQSGRAARIGTVLQPAQPFGIVAHHGIAERLPLQVLQRMRHSKRPGRCPGDRRPTRIGAQLRRSQITSDG